MPFQIRLQTLLVLVFEILAFVRYLLLRILAQGLAIATYTMQCHS